MSNLLNLLKSLFAKKASHAAPDQESNVYSDGNISMYSPGDLNTIERKIKSWLPAILQKGAVNFSWESGNDEAFLTVEGFEENNVDTYDLEYYLIDKLGIPDAGEFQMLGKGTLFIKDNKVSAKYESVLKGMIDYDEEKEEEIWGEEIEESNEKALFII